MRCLAQTVDYCAVVSYVVVVKGIDLWSVVSTNQNLSIVIPSHISQVALRSSIGNSDAAFPWRNRVSSLMPRKNTQKWSQCGIKNPGAGAVVWVQYIEQLPILLIAISRRLHDVLLVQLKLIVNRTSGNLLDGISSGHHNSRATTFISSNPEESTF